MSMQQERGVDSVILDAYAGTVRRGVVVEDLGTHWRVRWGRRHSRIRKDRVGSKPKRQGPWWLSGDAEVER